MSDDDARTIAPIPPFIYKQASANFTEGVVTIAYVERISGFLGLSEAYPENDVIDNVENPLFPKMGSLEKFKFTIWRGTACDSPITAFQPFKYTTKDTNSKVFGVVLADYTSANGTGFPQPHEAFGHTLAHELAHLMNLRHRTSDENQKIHDQLKIPVPENLMIHGTSVTTRPPHIAVDLDLIQIWVMRGSKMLGAN